MIKNYFSVLSAFLFCILSYLSGAQVTAGSDFAEIPFSGQTTMAIPNVLSNDIVGPFPANFANATLVPITHNFPNVSIENDGSVWVVGGAMFNPGVYTIFYRLKENADLLNFDFGSVTVNVGSCLLPDISANVTVTPSCNTDGSVALSDLPNGNWTLLIWKNGVAQTPVQGSGNAHTLSSLPSGMYHFSVLANNCQSLPVKVPLYNYCGLTLDFASTYVDLNGDGAVSQGDAIDYAISVTNNRETTVSYIQVSPGLSDSSIIINGEPIPSLEPGQTDSTTFTGTRMITQESINAGFVSDRVDVLGTINLSLPMPVMSSNYASTYLDRSDGLELVAFMDINNNGTQDTGEPNFTQGNFLYQINNEPAHEVITDGSLLLYESNPANMYDISFSILPQASPYFSSAIAALENVTVAAGSGITRYNFPIVVVPHNDLLVNLSPYMAAPRPGFNYSNLLTYRNNGTSTVAGTLTFTHAPEVTLSLPAGATAITNGFTFDFVNLMPNESHSFIINMAVPTIPTVALGDVLLNTATVSLAAEDVNTANNQSSLSQVIVGSYDPNDKTEAHGGKILHSSFTSEDVLTYTIRFENSGTAEAFNVRIEDLLDDRLDETSVRMVRASHPYVLNRVCNSLTWRMDGINLPPSQENSDMGHGSVTFTIKPKAGYAVGDIIENKADIYFDFNPAIVTEPAVTEFVAPLSVSQFAAGTISAYPNPVAHTLQITANDPIDEIRICSLLGQTVIGKKVFGKNATLDVSQLESGVYLLKIQSGQRVESVKIAKK